MTKTYNVENTQALARAIKLINETFGDRKFTRSEYEKMRDKFFEENPQFTSTTYYYGSRTTITDKNILPCWSTIKNYNILTNHGRLKEREYTHIWLSDSEYTLDEATILMPISVWKQIPDEAKDTIIDAYESDYKYLIEGFETEEETRKSKCIFYSLSEEIIEAINRLAIATELLAKAQENIIEIFK